MPRVSIIIPTFNCARFIARTIDSVLNQTYRDYEIIVVDDGSSDDTANIVDDYGEVKYFYQSNCGVSAARNRALKESTGELIAYLDADDMWYPHKLDLQVAFLDAHEKCGVLHSDVSVINEGDEIIHVRFNSETGRPVPQGYCNEDLLRRCHVQTPTVIERRECIAKAGGFDERLPVAQDYMHWIMIALEGWAFGYIDEPLAKYRWRTGSLMSSKRNVLEDHARIFGMLLPGLSARYTYANAVSAIIHDRFLLAERELAYLDRLAGDHDRARFRLTALIQRFPLQPGLYMDFSKVYLKSCMSRIVGRTYRESQEARGEVGRAKKP